MENFKLERPVLAVDVIIFCIRQGKLTVMLRKRENEPFKGAAALPGVAVRIDETLEKAACRAINDKIPEISTADGNLYLEQLGTFDALYRDPRGRTVSVVFTGIVRQYPDQGSGLILQPVETVPAGSLPFDHNLILDTALNRLRGKLRYTSIARAFLPETFRIEALQEIYEAVLGVDLNRANFRSKLLKIGMIEQVTVLSEAIGKKGGRPPHLYRFTGSGVEAADREFL